MVESSHACCSGGDGFTGDIFIRPSTLSSRRRQSMIGLSRWCMTHRRWVILAWLAVAVGTNFIAAAVGRNYATNFTLPGTESQRVADLLTHQFKVQSGDVDTIVF